MPSSLGHTLAGLCGYLAAKNHVVSDRRGWLLVGSVIIANLADLDFLPGLLLGDPRTFHHQATHSLASGMIVSLLVAGLASLLKLNGFWWGVWGGGVYLSHVVFDLLVNDPKPPFGVQLFWPFSETYVISPIRVFSSFDYFDTELGIVKALLSVQNLASLIIEALLVIPLLVLAWYFSKYHSGGYLER